MKQKNSTSTSNCVIFYNDIVRFVLFICNLFNDAVSNFKHIAMNYNEESTGYGRMWMEAAVA